MRIRIVEHYSQESGHFLGHTLQFKPFALWPVWMKMNGNKLYTNENRMEHDIVFAFQLDGKIKEKRVYD